MGDPGVEKPSRRGLSTFLAEHEDCGGGFEVQRWEDSAGSIVRVICGGCRQSIEYPAASDEELIWDQAASESSSRRTRRNRAAERPPSKDEKESARSAAPTKKGEPRRRDSGAGSISWRSWLPGLIAGLVGGALVLIVLAIASGGGGSGHPSAPGAGSANSSTPTAPPASAPTRTSPAPPAKRQSKPSHHATRLDQRRLAERVSIGVPRGWSAGVDGGAVTLLAGNGKAEVQVYYEQGARSDTELAQASKKFLLQRHPGARVAAVGRTETGGRQARTVRVTYPGGIESATVLVAGGYSYLILKRLGKPSSREARQTTDAVAMSFRPV
ncbi:MAG TPA: hypothetical protein VFY30_11385 [Solirubrobacterales bacterium]|nr:hypothetical protein [Solirubrobacterales bacterium]